MKEKNKGKNIIKLLKILTLILLVILTSMIGFFGIYKQEQNRVEDIIKGYSYSMDINSALASENRVIISVKEC